MSLWFCFVPLIPQADNRWNNVRYQLLKAICGTALQAKKDTSMVAVFLMHEFRTVLTTAEKLKVNEDPYMIIYRCLDIIQNQV